MAFRLGGLVAAPFTPFDENGDLRLAVIEQQAAFLVRAGVKGAFVCGTTGEGLSLTTDERLKVAERWVAAAGNSLKVIVHVGHNAQGDAVALARHAAKIGAGAVSALSPFFFKPGNVDQVVDFMRPVAAAAGELPFYFYHIPSMTGVSLSMVEFLQSAAGTIPNLHGIKFTHSDLMDYQRCLGFEGGKFEIAWGVDEMLLGALAAGAEAAVGSTYNYAAPLYLKMIDAFRANDWETARQIGRKTGEMVAILLKFGGLRTGKLAMKLAGVDCGPPRSPIGRFSAEEERIVREAYEKVGAFALK